MFAGLCAIAIALGLSASASAAPPAGSALTGVEGQPLAPAASAGTLLAETDLGEPAGSEDPATTPVRIDWGDGTSSPCVFYDWTAAPNPEANFPSNPPPNSTSGGSTCWFWRGIADSFSPGIYGNHVYHLPDVVSTDGALKIDHSYQWTITLAPVGGSSGEMITGTAKIADAPLTGHSLSLKLLSGVGQSTTVARFTDADPGGQPGDYQASINWGDHSPADTNVTITPAAGPADASSFAVSASHAYAATGTYTITTTLTDQIPNRVGYGPVTISSAATVASSGADAISVQEGTPFSGVLAKYCGPAGAPTSVRVDWGDKTPTTSGSVAGIGGGCWTVSASHTYREASASPYTFTVTPAPATWGAAVSGHASVTDAPVSATWDTAAVAAAGTSLNISSVRLAVVHDGNASAPACASSGPCDVSATVNWGDGKTSPGTVVGAGGGNLAITGSHTYADPGDFVITVTAIDKGGAAAQASGVYQVTGPPPLGAGCLAPIPGVGATVGLYGLSKAPGTPNWGVSTDDRVLRFGNLVVCALDEPWTYEGAGPVSISGGGTPGTFQVTGRIIVNGIELQPVTGASTPYVIDTVGSGEISGPESDASITEEVKSAMPGLAGDLGRVDLTHTPWAIQGSALAVLPGSSAAVIEGLPVSGKVPVDITGLGTVSVPVAIRLPGAFTLGPYSGGPLTSSHTFIAAYPAIATAGPVRPPLTRDAPFVCSLPTPPGLPIHLTFPSAYIGGMEVSNGYVDYDPSTGTADGGALFSINGATVSGFFGFQNNSFEDAGGCASGLAAPIIPELLQLDAMSFDVFLNPTRFNATATVGVVGLGTSGSVVDLTGGTMVVFATSSHTYTYDQDASITGQDDIPGTSSILDPNPFRTFTVGLGADFSPFGLPLTIHGYVLSEVPTYLEFGGSWGINLQPLFSAQLTASGQLWGDGDFDIEADGNVNIADVFGGGAHVIVSNKGVIGCGNVTINYVVGSTTISVGAGYHWHGGFDGPWFFNCSNNYGSYRVTDGPLQVATVHDAPSASAAFTLPAGLPDAMVRVTGTGGAPAISVRGPGGAQATSGGIGQITDGSDGVVVVRSDSLSGTWIGVPHPAAGTWTLTPLSGSVPIADIAVADGLPPASVTARVTGSGYRRVLNYSIRPRPGQSVQFVESGPGAGKLIGTAHGTRGSIAFTPAIGPAGRRQIIALVALNGGVAQRIVAATYAAPGPPVARAPTRLVVARAGARLRISWRPGINTDKVLVMVVTTDGQHLSFVLPVRTHTLTVADPLEGGVSVSAAGFGPDGNTGPLARARIAALGAPGRIAGLAITRRGSAVRVGWHAAARAQSYRVTIVVGTARAVLILTRARTLTLRGIGTSAVRVSVAAEGPTELIGPSASARLGAVVVHRRR